MKSLVIRSHLGAGDMLIINAIVRERATKFDEVYLPCKTHNVPSVRFMFRDLPNVYVWGVRDDNEADKFTSDRIYCGSKVLGLGLFAYEKEFDIDQWDREMYRQAGLPFEQRWDGFRAVRDPSRELEPGVDSWVFAHQDSARRFEINVNRMPRGNVLSPIPGRRHNIFDYWPLIENAEEIHCIDSCFAILADSIPTKAKRHVLHLYARPGALPPHYRKNWEILR